MLDVPTPDEALHAEPGVSTDVRCLRIMEWQHVKRPGKHSSFWISPDKNIYACPSGKVPAQLQVSRTPAGASAAREWMRERGHWVSTSGWKEDKKAIIQLGGLGVARYTATAPNECLATARLLLFCAAKDLIEIGNSS